MNSRSTNEPSDNIGTAVSESISALLDNQGDDLDLRRILKETEANSGVRAKWQRYHIASSVMKKESSPLLGIDLSEQIRMEIAQEAVHSGQASKSKGRWLDVLAKSSIAASVAVGLLFGVPQLVGVDVLSSSGHPGGSLANGEPLIAPDLNSAVIPAGFSSPALSARTVSTAQGGQANPLPFTGAIQALPENVKNAHPAVDPDLQAQFNRLMMIHAQQVSSNSDLGVLSIARLTDLNALSDKPETAASEAAEEPVNSASSRLGE
ncbi:sigma-E factor negative regulatory protein [Teredinibacter haidensis]|uniref:sigma-E factor negative regulatory protein n=1 Tax=Teredinibacter haidensis TaxID=2731755 RepID=UPI000948D842|nr:sigma-E factor negative regulatory protein [Teredinibacter haidensis]